MGFDRFRHANVVHQLVKYPTRSKNWAEFLLMHDARTAGSRDLFPMPISKEYLSLLTDEDHVKVIRYLCNAPVSYNKLCLALVNGFAGSGKLFFAATIIVARFLGNPDEHILCLAAANKPTNVLIRKVNFALETAKTSNPKYQELLANRVAVRVYTDQSESSYIISLAEDRYRTQPSHSHVVGKEAVHEGADNELSFFGPLLEGGVVDLNHPSVPPGLEEHNVAIEMVQTSNRQLRPNFSGFRERRFSQPEYSIVNRAIHYAYDNPVTWSDFSSLLERYSEEGPTVLPEDLHRFKDITKTLLGTTKGLADAVGVTINALGSASIRTNFGKFKLVILDEGGVVDLAQLLITIASVYFDNLIIFGDDNQLDPAAPQVSGPFGCTRELSQSVITYIRSNHWKSASLYLQRQGPPNISVVSSPLFYRGEIKDAPCTSHPDSHPKTLIFLDFFKKLFPEVSSDLPHRYLDVRGHNEIKNNTTGSWMNVDTAAIIVLSSNKAFFLVYSKHLMFHTLITTWLSKRSSALRTRSSL